MIPVVIPTWSLDAPCVLESVGALIDGGKDPAEIAVAHNPERGLPTRTTDLLRSSRVSIIEHDYAHRRTPEDFTRLQTSLLGWAMVHDTEYVLKLDSDTIIRRWGHIEDAVKERRLVATPAWPGNLFVGCCSLYSKDALRVLSRVDSYNALEGHMTNEDQAFHYVLAKVFGPEAIHNWWYRKMGGLIKGWRYTKEEFTMEDYADRYDVVTFGNRKQVDGKCTGEKHEIVAKTMAEFRNVLASQA